MERCLRSVGIVVRYSQYEDSTTRYIVFSKKWNDMSENDIVLFLDKLGFPIEEFSRGPGRAFSHGLHVARSPKSGRWHTTYFVALDI
jgi:hypothetical protein